MTGKLSAGLMFAVVRERDRQEFMIAFNMPFQVNFLLYTNRYDVEIIGYFSVISCFAAEHI